MITWRPIFRPRLAILMQPALGVVPPSIRLSQSSTRSAPPRCAAKAPATESTQISIRINPMKSREGGQEGLGGGAGIGSLVDRPANDEPVRTGRHGFLGSQRALLV